MPNVAFILNAPGDAADSWVQIAKVGNYTDPRYGKFSITEKDLDKWVENFYKLSKTADRLGAPIDVDHGPEKHGNTEAAGWATEMEKRGKELWAQVEWNTLGKDLIDDKRYAYLSPSYTGDYKDETGKSFGTHIVGVGLTNRPFLRMATVSLSADIDCFAQEVDSPHHMLLDDLRKTLGLPDDADEATVLAAVVVKATPAAEQGTKTLDDQAKAEGKVVLDATKVLELTSKAERGDAAANELSLMKFDREFTLAIDEGRKTPAEKDDYLKLYEVAPEATLDAIKKAPKILSTELRGSDGGGGEDAGITSDQRKDAEGYTIDDDRAALDTKANAIMLDKGITYSEALVLAERA